MVECEEFVPAVLRLMEARNDYALDVGDGVLSCKYLAAFSRCLSSLSFLAVSSRYLFLITFLVATSRCLLLCLPLAVLPAALSESAVACLSLLCWSLFSIVLSNCLAISLACFLELSDCRWPLMYVFAGVEPYAESSYTS